MSLTADENSKEANMAITSIRFRKFPMRKIHIVENTTRYSTMDIKRIVRGCVERLVEWPAWRGVRVYVKYKRRWSCVAGRGYLGGDGIFLYMQRWAFFRGENNAAYDTEQFQHSAEDLAHTVFHELEHNLGKTHKDIGSYDTAWAASLPLRHLGTRKPKVEIDKDTPTYVRWELVRKRREAHAREMLQRYEKKLKRTEALIRKWRKRVRYYEKLHKPTARPVPEEASANKKETDNGTSNIGNIQG
jgi:hypothetical protein